MFPDSLSPWDGFWKPAGNPQFDERCPVRQIAHYDNCDWALGNSETYIARSIRSTMNLALVCNMALTRVLALS